MPPTRTFTFVCGQDDYLVSRTGQDRFAALAAGTADDLSREVISGFAGTVDEVAQAVNRLRESVQTLPLFGGRRAVWLKDVNFLGDTPAGRAESTEALVDDLRQVLEAVNPAEAAVLITACPVDRRRSFFKWCEKNADFLLADSGGGEGLAEVAIEEAKALGASFGPGAAELLLERVGSNARLLVEETRKLASYAARPGGGPVTIAEGDVAELTPNVAEGDFFESAEAFFSGDLQWTLAALHRHFFTGGDARPVIASLQNRNRLLLQMRALVDAGGARLDPRGGLQGLADAASSHAEKFGEAAGVKSSYNIFTQHPYYLGKLASSGKLPGLRRLIDNQQEFVAALEEIIRRPDEQEEVLRDLAVRCLAGN